MALKHWADTARSPDLALAAAQHLDESCERFGCMIAGAVNDVHESVTGGSISKTEVKTVSHRGCIRCIPSEALQRFNIWYDLGTCFMEAIDVTVYDPSLVYDPSNNTYGRLHASVVIGMPATWVACHNTFNDEKVGDYLEFLLSVARDLRLGRNANACNRYVRVLHLVLDWEELALGIETVVRAVKNVQYYVPVLGIPTNGNMVDSQRWAWFADEIRIGLAQKAAGYIVGAIPPPATRWDAHWYVETCSKMLPETKPLSIACTYCLEWIPLWEFLGPDHAACSGIECVVQAGSRQLEDMTSFLDDAYGTTLFRDYLLASMPPDIWYSHGKDFCKRKWGQTFVATHDAAPTAAPPDHDPELYDPIWCEMFGFECLSACEICKSRENLSLGIADYADQYFCGTCWHRFKTVCHGCNSEDCDELTEGTDEFLGHFYCASCWSSFRLSLFEKAGI